MSICGSALTHPLRPATRFLALALVVALCSVAEAQVVTQAVGGVSIDSSGLLTNASFDDLGKLRQMRAAALEAIPEGLDQRAGMRKVSLRRLEAAIQQCVESGKPLPDAVRYLAGLQQIQYVLVYPEQNDIVLVGPGEGWKVDAKGAVVGQSTGRPVMLLDDLLDALRSANNPTRSVISCSIDPTPEGLQRLRNHVRKLHTIGNPQRTATGIEQQLGPQKISVNGVPDTSHFARVMVAADYRMKRVSMNLEPAPIAGLPSFLEMMKASGRGMSNMLPRWWLAPDYQPLLRDAEGLAWELRKAAVKAMAENDFLDAAGIKHQTGSADPVSQKWGETMTRRYGELAQADTVFGQLRNCMDLAIVAALIVKENLIDKAGLSIPMLVGPSGPATTQLNAPKQVASKASLVHKGHNWMIACGGVQINPWAIVDEVEQSDTLPAVRSQATIDDDAQWWSN